MKDISVIIVNYRVKFFLEQTIASVIEASKGLDVEIIVVDNMSGDDSIAHSKQRFGDRVIFIENTENVGFARANNQAILGTAMPQSGTVKAQGQYTLILNPDTIITHDALAQCVQWMKTHPNCGAIGVHMIDGNGVFLPESKRAFPTPWVSFCKIFGLSSIFPKSRLFARYHLRFLPEHESHKIDILAGAYMFCRTQLLQRIGGFDEDFFMYGEDIDLSYRITTAGYENRYLPVSIIHYKGESTKKESMRYVEVFYDAMLIFYRKHYPQFGKVAYPIIKAGVALRKSMAMVRRKLFKPHPTSSTATTNAVILSANPQHLAGIIGISSYATEIPANGNCDVFIDNSRYSYAEIVMIIEKYSRHGIAFHIFSSENNTIISPKNC